MKRERKADARRRFLDAALRVIRTKGYEATTIDDLCRATGLTKGSFFHHFTNKEEMGLAAAAHFAAMADSLFASAPYRCSLDPLERVLGYLDFRAELLAGELPDVTCLLGTIVQECYTTHPALRVACERHLTAHAEMVTADIAEAKAKYAPAASWSPASLALHTQAVLQGAFVLAKAQNDPAIAVDSVRHLRRYIELLFSGGAAAFRDAPD